MNLNKLSFLHLLIITFFTTLIFSPEILAVISLPGTDQSDKLQMIGTLLRIIDSVLFNWIARLLAALCVLSFGWNIKEQQFVIAVVCLIAAIVIATIPIWVKNIFEIGGGSIFSSIIQQIGIYYA